MDEMLRKYYTLMDWGPETGVLLRGTLENLGLGYVADDLTF
jgi:aldehyde:ferredoxin oxidoreductase